MSKRIKLYIIDPAQLVVNKWWLNLLDAAGFQDYADGLINNINGLLHQFNGKVGKRHAGRITHLVFHAEHEVAQFLLKWG